jgi:hypothetical protein
VLDHKLIHILTPGKTGNLEQKLVMSDDTSESDITGLAACVFWASNKVCLHATFPALMYKPLSPQSGNLVDPRKLVSSFLFLSFIRFYTE